MHVDYEYLLETFYAEVLSKGTPQLIIDVGAHTGRHTRPFSEIAGAAGRVLAIEPLPECQETLNQWVCGLENRNVDVVKGAVSAQAGHSSFVFARDRPEESGLRQRAWFSGETRIENIEVEVFTLDELLEKNSGLGKEAPVTFIKIDVEGGELDVIRGACETIRNHRPFVAFEHAGKSSEVYDGSSALIFREFQSQNYHVISLRGERIVTEAEFIHLGSGKEVWDFVAIPDQKGSLEGIRIQHLVSTNFFQESDRQRQVVAFYQRLLRRDPTEQEIRSQSIRMRSIGLEQFLGEILNSPERAALERNQSHPE